MVGVQQGGQPFIGFSGHLANFELMPIVAYNHGLNLTVVSRPVNNPLIQRILLYFRERPTGNWGRVPKGVDGARQAVKLLDEGLNLGVLVDQRTTQGIALPLFGRQARSEERRVGKECVRKLSSRWEAYNEKQTHQRQYQPSRESNKY